MFVDDGAVVGADEVVVAQEAAVRVELAPGLERDRVQTTLRVGQLDALPHLEDAAAVVRTGDVGLLGVGLLGVGHGSTV